jgi:hypothetical protein
MDYFSFIKPEQNSYLNPREERQWMICSTDSNIPARMLIGDTSGVS